MGGNGLIANLCVSLKPQEKEEKNILSFEKLKIRWKIFPHPLYLAEGTRNLTHEKSRGRGNIK